MRIDRLSLKDFTVFAQADMDFSPGLNVLIGANGTGKSHVLKVLYSFLRPLASTQTDTEIAKPVFAEESSRISDKLHGVFRLQPDSSSGWPKSSLYPLMRHGALRFEAEVRADFGMVSLHAECVCASQLGQLKLNPRTAWLSSCLPPRSFPFIPVSRQRIGGASCHSTKRIVICATILPSPRYDPGLPRPWSGQPPSWTTHSVEGRISKKTPSVSSVRRVGI